MKKITFLLGFSLITMSDFAQTKLEELLVRYDNIQHNGNSIHAFFNAEELETLKAYFNTSYSVSNTAEVESSTVFGHNSSLDAFVSFNLDSPENTNVIGDEAPTTDFESAGDIDPNNLDKAYVLTPGGEFYELDIPSAVYTFLGIISAPNGEQWSGLEFDPGTGVLYGISSFNNTSTLSTIDIENLIAIPIGQAGISCAIAIATDGTGNFYTYDVCTDLFYSIDTTNGLATVIGSIGFNADFAQDMEWDPISQTMYMTAFNIISFDGELRTVDLNTGNTTFIGFLGETTSNISWASIPTEITLSTEDFESINFSIYPNPSKDFLTIEGNNTILKATVYDLTGKQLLGQDVSTNSASIDLRNLTQGMYMISVTTNNSQQTYRFIKQ